MYFKVNSNDLFMFNELLNQKLLLVVFSTDYIENVFNVLPINILKYLIVDYSKYWFGIKL